MITLASPLRRLFDVVDSLVDDRVGIVRCVEEVPKEAGAPNFFHFYARACDTTALSSQRNFGETGGASADRGLAMAKAIGEAVERYCSAIYDAEELPFTSLESAPFRCVRPDDFALYSVEQYKSSGFRYLPFTHSTPVRWTPTIDPATGETWYVPAAMVLIPYFYDRQRDEHPIAQPISTGLACHCSAAEAAISAICEVIERDAFTITWQAQLGMPKILIETLSEQNRDLVARFERTGASVTLLNLTLDHGVPTILAVLRTRACEMPSMVFAASTDPASEQAVRKSLEELAHTRRLAQHLKATMPPLPTSNYDQIVDQAAHVRFYCDETNAALADFIFASSKRIEFNSIETLATGHPQIDLEILIERIHTVNHRVLLADLTTPDVSELGLSVVRALIPGFHPLFMGHRCRALGGSRLWEVPQKLGYEGISRESGDNPAAHPYP